MSNIAAPRILSREVKQHAGQTVRVEGWLHKKRLLGGLTFISLRDRAGVVQIVIQDKSTVELLRGLQVGTVLRVDGKVVTEPRAAGGAELHDPVLSVIVPVTEEPPIEIDKPLSHKPDNLDTLFENRVLGLRNLQETAIFRIRSELERLIRQFLYEHDFTEINTPKLVAGAAEGGAEVFRLDYFGREATLAQSPQLYKQMMVGVFERVFEIAPAYRAELSATTRHVSEVTMLDVEMGFIDGHDDVLNLLQDLLQTVLSQIYDSHRDTLRSLGAPDLALKLPFPRYSMAEIHRLYSRHTGHDTSHEIDLTPDEERWICDYARQHDGCEAVFATGLPLSKMKFYHMKGDDDTARSADLLFRGIEIATAPQREHRYDVLVGQMRAAGIDPQDPGFSYYLQAFRHGLPPHGGFGFGIDRLCEKTLGLGNIKEAILFPRDINRLTP